MNELLKRAQSFMAETDEYDVADAIGVLEDRFGKDLSIKLLEEVTKVLKSQLKQILSKDLLEWMHENDQVQFETEGAKVSIKTYVASKVLDSDKAFSWLEENQYGDLIKDNLEFPKGELTSEAESLLNKLGLSFIKKSGIHPQSLKKIMSDRVKEGDILPDEGEGFSVSYYDECVVKPK